MSTQRDKFEASRSQKKLDRWSIARRRSRFFAIAAGLAVISLTTASSFMKSAASSARSASVNSRSDRAAAIPSTSANSLFAPVDGTITIKSGNYQGPPTTQTAHFTKQIFTSGDCTTGGGSIDAVTGADSVTGHSFTVPAGQSVQVKVPLTPVSSFMSHVSEQNGPFVQFGPFDSAAYGSSISNTGTATACIQGFAGPGERIYLAYYYAGIELFDSCGNESFSFRPGDSITIKVSGGLTGLGEAMRFIVAGGSANECAFVPPGPAFTTVHVNTDPFIYTFTLPSSDSEIHPSCASGGTTSILGNWRALVYDVPGCGCNRNSIPFTLANDAPLPSCLSLTCPTDITQSNDPGSCGAIVNYTTPSAPNPATVTCDYPAGSVFPVGTTLVTCTSSAGPSCSFNVTVNDVEDPTISAPANVTVPTDSDSCVATGVSLGTPTTGDNCLVSSVTNNAPAQFPLGTTTVIWTVNDNHGRSATAAQTVTVVDNTAPSLTVPAGSTGAANASCQASIPNVAAGSTASDNCGGVTITQSPVAGTLVGLGPHTITVTATDTAGNYTDKPVTFTVNDNTAPTITLNGNAITLWPPHHQYETISVSDLVVSASDNCDAMVGLGSVYISQVTSDEVENGKGDGNTLNDIVIAADCKSVQLRSERQGGGNGRVYTITFKVRDASNNFVTATAQVTVPKSQNGSPAIDDGPHYTVISGCP